MSFPLSLSACTLAALTLSSCSSLPLGRLPTTKNVPTEAVPPVTVDVQSIEAPLPGDRSSAGGLIAADVNGDGQRDLVVTRPERIAAYSLGQGKLWERTADIKLSSQAEKHGLPGLHGPGVQASDVDGDGDMEVLYVARNNLMEILAGATGEIQNRVELPPVEAKDDAWEHAIVANFSGQGDQEILLQTSRKTDKKDYFRDSIQAAFNLSELIASGPQAQPLWVNEDFVSLSHGVAKVVDLNLDGKDEVVGGTILSSTGEVLYAIDIGNTSFPHLDSLGIDDIDPQRPGLEAVVPEEAGGLRVILFDETGTIWSDRHRNRTTDIDGDKVSVGDFDPETPGLEMWFRGNDSAHFTALNAAGEVIASYTFADRQPEGWTDSGLDVIHRIRWSGGDQDYIVAKERHEAGDVGIFNPLTGQLMAQFPAKTERLYVADIVGDWREEIIVQERDRIQIIQNMAPNPRPNEPSLWEQPHYRRQKMTWNYYSP